MFTWCTILLQEILWELCCNPGQQVYSAKVFKNTWRNELHILYGMFMYVFYNRVGAFK
jgi:hypothetical protein